MFMVGQMVSEMNFVHHISKVFRDFGGGYFSAITHTIAHELGHGLMLSEANAQGCLSIGKKSPGAEDDNKGTGGNFMGYDDRRRHWYKHQFRIISVR